MNKKDLRLLSEAYVRIYEKNKDNDMPEEIENPAQFEDSDPENGDGLGMSDEPESEMADVDPMDVEVEADENPRFYSALSDLAETLIDNYLNFYTTGSIDEVETKGLLKYIDELFNQGDHEGMLEDYGDDTLKNIGYLKLNKYSDHLREIFDFVAENWEDFYSASKD